MSETPMERGYRLTREHPDLLNELARNLFKHYHFNPNTNPIGRAVWDMGAAHAAWGALTEGERQRWRDEVLIASEEELAANAVGEMPPQVAERKHKSRPDCWCGPKLFVRCDEHENDDDEWAGRCWRCEATNGLVPIARDDAKGERVIIVHFPPGATP